MNALTRRRFFIQLGSGAVAAGAAGALPWTRCHAASDPAVPPWLEGFDPDYAKHPRPTNLRWFDQARFGLFMHYGLYSLLGRHEWVQLREKIPVAEYARLADRFTAEKFDADFITDLALEAGMRYVNITTRHHDSFCLFDSKLTDFKSTNTPAKRDLVGELTEQCQQKGLGIFYYYSHGRDWRHPHAPNNDRWGGSARPNYAEPDPHYAVGAEHDLGKYVEFMSGQIAELLSNYGPVSGIWLDGIATPMRPKEGTGARTEDFQSQALYDQIRAAQPQVLVSYKQALLGTEDFMAPERHFQGKPEKPLEVCDTLQPKGWGYIAADDGNHKGPDDVMKMLAAAGALPANLLLNTGPLPDGAIHSEDVTTLREVGRRIRQQGWPA